MVSRSVVTIIFLVALAPCVAVAQQSSPAAPVVGGAMLPPVSPPHDPNVLPPMEPAGEAPVLDMSEANPAAREAFLQGTAVWASDANQALELFTRAAQASPKFYGAQFNVATLLQGRGDFQGAVQAYRSALAVKPDFAPAAVGLAATYQLMPGQVAGAERTLRDFLAAHPDSLAARAALAEFLARTSRFDEAHREAIAVLQHDERNTHAMLALGIAYRRQRKVELAALALNEALEIDPHLGEAYNELGLVLLAQGEKARAVQAFDRAAAASPHVAAIANNLGVLQTEVGAFKAAVESLKRATVMRPDRPEYFLNLGNALRGDGQYADAEVAYKKALEGGSSEALFNLGVLYLDNEMPGKDALQRYRDSINFLRSYADRNPTNADLPRLQEYVQTAEKAMETEQKRLTREAQRKEKEAKGAQEPGGNAAPPAQESAGMVPQPTPAPPPPAPVPERMATPAAAPENVDKDSAQREPEQRNAGHRKGKGRKGKAKGKLRGKFKDGAQR